MRSLPVHVERALIAQLYQVRDEIKAQMREFRRQLAADFAQVYAELDRLDAEVAETVELCAEVRRRHAIKVFRELEHNAEPTRLQIN
jgi:uncharacterized protein YPO0396